MHVHSNILERGNKLLLAAKRGNIIELVSHLNEKSPIVTDWLGFSPLHLACMNGHFTVSEILCSRASVAVDARTKVDKTALHLASQKGYLDIVQLLLNFGADVNAKDMLLMTALHWACENRHLPVISLLLDHGADLYAVNKFSLDATQIAIKNGFNDVLNLLQSRDPNVQNSNVCHLAGTLSSETNGFTSREFAIDLSQISHPLIETVAMIVQEMHTQDSISIATQAVTRDHESVFNWFYKFGIAVIGYADDFSYDISFTHNNVIYNLGAFLDGSGSFKLLRHLSYSSTVELNQS
ncbi:hypothetical protein Ciccas_010559 [Cichlidogyrus casuarinus]|uniref:Ankyrin repeat protein n=1 Tax=Cichlidogyrus casuarinus TaxID=1844966 RepID=A0ABD2PUL9_9PLAT